MRVIFILLMLVILAGCGLIFDPYRVVMSDSQGVLIEYDTVPMFSCTLNVQRCVRPELMHAAAQRVCNRYGKDAALIREENGYTYSRRHYRCLSRLLDQVNDVQ